MDEKVTPREYDGEVKIKSKLTERIENFFYHYKWHTLIALFLIFTITVCTLQTCQKSSYDAYILYAGGTNISSTPKEGEEDSMRDRILASSKKFIGDYDADGAKSISFMNLFIPSPEELAEMENSEYFSSMVMENNSALGEYAYYGEFYICLLSERLFLTYSERKDANPFAAVEDFLPKDTAEGGENGYILANDFGVYLSSTPLSSLPGFRELEEDTVICLRKYSSLGTRGSSKKSRAFYDFSCEVFSSMLSGKAYN